MKTPTTCAVLAVSLLATAQSGPTVPLQNDLFAVSNEFMVRWQKHDTVGLAALLSPAFIYVGPNGPIPRRVVVNDVGTHCDLKSYRLGTPQMLQTSSESAVLIYSIHQDLTCFGHPQPTDVENTDTFIRQGGRWVLVMTTTVTLEQHS
jgi:hypothetical protein